MCGGLTQRRVRWQERFDQSLSACTEFPKIALHLLQQSQRAKMNSGLERQTRIVEVAPDLSVEVGDRAQLFGIDQMFGNPNQTLVCVHRRHERMYKHANLRRNSKIRAARFATPPALIRLLP